MTAEGTALVQQDSLTIASSWRSDEKVEVLLKRKPAAKARRLQSSREASLFDPYCTDDEGPALEAATDDSSSSQSQSSGKGYPSVHSTALAVPESSTISMMESSLARFTESMASFLCGGVSDSDIAVMRIQSNRPGSAEVSHADGTLQSVLCSMPCSMSTHLCSQSDSVELIQSPQHGNEQCSDVALSDIRKALASDITTMLSSTSLSTNSWLLSLDYYFWFDSRRFEVKSPPVGPRRKIRNRCGLRKAQAARLRHLWYKWHSQSATDGNRSVEVTSWAYHLGNTKSFDDSVSAVDFAPDGDSLDLCYDSDPELFLRAPRSNSRPPRTPRRDFRANKNRPVQIDTSASYGSICEKPQPPVHRQMQPSLSFGTRSFDSCTQANVCSDRHKNDGVSHPEGSVSGKIVSADEADRDLVQEIMMGKVKLRYHPGQDQIFGSKLSGASNATTGTPVSVQGWFEMGSRLSSKIVHPQFVWKEVFQPNLHPRRKLGLSYGSLELLAIVRILKPVELDRGIYPYAILDNSFVLHSQSGDVYVFESPSRHQRDRFVHGLKLVVSRLASMIIVGDHQMFVEFFSPWALSPVLDDMTSECSGSSSEDDSEDEAPTPFFLSTSASDRKRLWGSSRNWLTT